VKLQFIILYYFFAVISSFINILFQIYSVDLYRGLYYIELSIFIGTIFGLLTKYLLDKFFIFKYKAINKIQDLRIFYLYCLTGVFTTLIFWFIEYLFYFIFNTDEMRYLGGVIGLLFGYSIKFKLDNRFVFRSI
jgi:putative flippase GtrA